MAELPTAVLDPTAHGRPAGARTELPRIAAIGGILALAVPAVVVVAFIARFATAMPVTDEWFFLRAVVALEQIGFPSLGNLGRIIQVLPYKIYYHDVIVPFLLYLPLAEVSNFDNRALLFVTLLSWIAVLLVFRYAIIRSLWWTAPVAAVLFSPGRYMEFLWGWQFTVVFSVLFPILGLVALGRINRDDALPVQIRKLLLALGLILLGTLSSAGGFFGFVGAIPVLAMLPLTRGSRLLLLELLLVATVIVFIALMQGSSPTPAVNLRNVLFILTALGSAIVGMPEAFQQFGLDMRSLLGAAVVVFMLASVALAARRHLLHRLAIPAGIFTFSICSVAAIAVARAYLGNWHLEYAVPAVCASYASCYIAFRELRSLAAAQLCLSSATVMMLALVGYYAGFAQYGPAYDDYVQAIQQYARSYLAQPFQPKPFPLTGGWDLNADMVWFLAAKHHAVFAAEDRAILAAPRTPAADAKAVVLGNNAENAARRVLVVASLSADRTADALILNAGGANVILRKTDPRLISASGCTAECFSGLALARSLPANIAANLSAVRIPPG